jgi:hypothetical protein
MFWIQGTSQVGLGAAAGNLDLELPMIAAEFPEVVNCHHGTINLLLDIPLLVAVPDHRTKPIPWHPSFGEGEVFDFLRISFEAPLGTSSTPAWLFIPHGSPHRQNLRYHEVLAPRLRLHASARCRVGIDRAAVQMPYLHFPLIVVV